ncbi:MAG: O-methyltransferase [Acidimicrobiia bacterium]
MTPKSFLLSPELHEYLLAHGPVIDDVQQELIDQTAALGDVSIMQVAPEQGALLTILTRLVGARHALEVGTFTGYSSLCIARGLAEGGRLLCCDVNEAWTSIARAAWAKAGVADRVELRLAPGLETLRALPTEPYLDLAFIDALKVEYIDYHEEVVPRLRPGGLLLVDNVLWSGKVLDPSVTDEDTEAIRRYNDHAAADERLLSVLVPIADGLTFAIRR